MPKHWLWPNPVLFQLSSFAKQSDQEACCCKADLFWIIIPDPKIQILPPESWCLENTTYVGILLAGCRGSCFGNTFRKIWAQMWKMKGERAEKKLVAIQTYLNGRAAVWVKIWEIQLDRTGLSVTHLVTQNIGGMKLLYRGRGRNLLPCRFFDLCV